MSFKFNRGLFKYDFIDHHAVLCVPVDADVKEIRKRYLKIARRLHPDTCRDESDAEKELANELLSKLVNPAYETLSGEKQRMEHILILSQMGKRLVQESVSVELKSDVTQQLASAPHFEHIYKSAVAQIAETQYDSLQEVQDTIALASELNLVYIMRSAGKIFAAASSAEIPTNAANKAAVTSPPQKQDSVVLQYIRRAQDLISQNQLTQARVELQDALKLEPNNSRCHSLIGVVYLKQNLTTSAKVHFNRALQLNPKDEIALAGRLKVEQITGQKSSGAKRTASSHTGSQQPGKSGGSGLFGGLFGGKKK
ncbi:molecular chaperone DnaJ [Brasilonema octagenarum UFV-E1]|uniref:Molecular chaperone DnaJ n=1 Tax=Brasilonema sennae CENA114 TaxID=415709 RepID=A0A856MKC5_9CYAN|nr:J domain-containing protein [Brasilonema sennae]QDL11138.1 molecular chaperone DnaJ [Brasilonema sennae CENA114]QDL17484.1 molecular chaperone DnaJ [Brasilonema octagenarum UFV-E1]